MPTCSCYPGPQALSPSLKAKKLTSLSSHPSGRSSLSVSESDVAEAVVLLVTEERGGAEGVASASRSGWAITSKPKATAVSSSVIVCVCVCVSVWAKFGCMLMI